MSIVRDQMFWYLTRAAGIVSWFSAAMSVLVGMLMATRFLGRKPTIPYLLDIHRFLGHLALIFLGIHMVTLWADSFVDVGVVDLLVPGALKINGYDTLALAVGVIAAWVMVLVEVTSLLKDKMPKAYWHAIHLNSYTVVILGAWHGVIAGSDAANRLLIGLGASVVTTIVLVTVNRMRPVRHAQKSERTGQQPSY